MRWGQVVSATVVGLSGGALFLNLGYSLTTVLAVVLLLYISTRWVIAWVYRVRYWHAEGTAGSWSTSCPDCGQYIYRMPGDWILQCKRCGWKAGLPGFRWLTHSVPSRQLRRTVRGPRIVLVVFLIALVLSGIQLGALVGPLDPPSGEAGASPVKTNTAVRTTTGLETNDAAKENPWDRETIVVAVRNTADSSRNFTAAVEAALNYWENNPNYGEYHAQFSLEPNTESPDIIVWYNHSVNCEDSSAAGCAPLLTSSSAPRSPESVQIKFNQTRNFRQTRNIVIHEFGHVLGLGHCTEPYWVMSHRRYCAGGDLSLRDVGDKEYAWRDHSLTYFVDYSGVSDETRTREQVHHAIGYFEEGGSGTVPDNITFTRVDSKWEADVTINFGDCEQNYSACPQTWGSDPDGDGVNEYHTKTAITIDEADVRARGWYVGWSLANSLTPDQLPGVFIDATYEEQRSNWWE